MDGQIYKICFLGEDEVVNFVAKKFNDKYKGKGLKFNSGSKFLLEVINPDCGKVFAVRFLADYYGVPLNEVIAVGDSTNDIDLIGGNWFGVAVGDGREELKKVTDEVTVPFEDDPVKLLLEKYCLN
jgi:hydroxymethylpyrimidine pyrophosphatase-like HAD family hydrolase